MQLQTVSPKKLIAFSIGNAKSVQRHEEDPRRYSPVIKEAMASKELVEWSKTTRGGKHYDLIPLTEDQSACSSVYGLCE